MTIPASSSKPATTRCVAFDGSRRIASGDLTEVATQAKAVQDKNASASILIFDETTGEVVEVDLRGTKQDLLARLRRTATHENEDVARDRIPRGPGRPKLGVVAREVTLLPRHWDWLGSQPGGASVALRRLVEDARRNNADRDRQRAAREAVYRFMSVMAGNEPGFEEATRALFADNGNGFEAAISAWPDDVRDHAVELAALAFSDPLGQGDA